MTEGQLDRDHGRQLTSSEQRVWDRQFGTTLFKLTEELVGDLALVLNLDRGLGVLDALRERNNLLHLAVGHDRAVLEDPREALKHLLRVRAAVVRNSTDEVLLRAQVQVNLRKSSQQLLRLETEALRVLQLELLHLGADERCETLVEGLESVRTKDHRN